MTTLSLTAATALAALLGSAALAGDPGTTIDGGMSGSAGGSGAAVNSAENAAEDAAVNAAENAAVDTGPEADPDAGTMLNGPSGKLGGVTLDPAGEALATTRGVGNETADQVLEEAEETLDEARRAIDAATVETGRTDGDMAAWADISVGGRIDGEHAGAIGGEIDGEPGASR